MIAVSTGEPAGIGPDIALMAALGDTATPVVLIGDRDLLSLRAQALGLGVVLEDFQAGKSLSQGHVAVCHVPLVKPSFPGQLDVLNASYVLEVLNTALSGCQDGIFKALVTCPIHKAILNEARGEPFLGHTEYLASSLNVDHPVMMFVAPSLRMVLVTRHLPLRQVPDALTSDRLEATIRVLHHDLGKWFGLSMPHLLIAGLNPHAGESGLLGQEEIEVISPLIDRLQQAGMRITGPFPADTIYQEYQSLAGDAMVMMYHDQGLPLLKSMGFGQGVNITLGLPILRTSVDHGTALHLAGTGRANPQSLLSGIRLAYELSMKHSGR